MQHTGTMFIQYYHQNSLTVNPVSHRLPRQIETIKEDWPIAEPLSPKTKALKMGCSPSRPSRSFYNEFLVEGKQKHEPKDRHIPRPQLQPPIQGKERHRTTIVPNLSYDEQVAMADLRIYQEEMKARKEEMDNRTFVRHMAMRGDELVF